MRLAPLLVSIALGVLPRAMLAQSIGISQDAEGGNCNGFIVPVGSSVTAYVLAYTLDPAGISGAEFRIAGLPAGQYKVTAVPNPLANVTLGDPFGDGCDIAFPDCQLPSAGVVLLYTVTLQNLSDTEGNRVLEVQQHATPSDPTYSCPRVTRYDPPLYTPLCVSGGRIGVYVTADVGLPVDPSPADGATEVPPDSHLSWSLKPFWCCDTGTLDQHLYFGTTPNPPEVAYDPPTPYDPGILNDHTTYYWSVAAFWTPCFDQRGPVWSFTTGTTVSREGTTWTGVKQLYRSR